MKDYSVANIFSVRGLIAESQFSSVALDGVTLDLRGYLWYDNTARDVCYIVSGIKKLFQFDDSSPKTFSKTQFYIVVLTLVHKCLRFCCCNIEEDKDS